MKHAFVLAMVSSVFIISSCKDQTGADYYDLNSGKKVDLVKDDRTGLMMNAETKEPVYIYVNDKTKDTIFGPSGKVINGHVIKLEDGKYKYEDLKVKLDEDGDFKIKDGDYKRKVEADGDIKIKDGDSKKKIDGETGKVRE